MAELIKLTHVGELWVAWRHIVALSKADHHDGTIVGFADNTTTEVDEAPDVVANMIESAAGGD